MEIFTTGIAPFREPVFEGVSGKFQGWILCLLRFFVIAIPVSLILPVYIDSRLRNLTLKT